MDNEEKVKDGGKLKKGVKAFLAFGGLAIVGAIIGSYITTLVNVGKLQSDIGGLNQRIEDAIKSTDDRFADADKRIDGIRDDIMSLRTDITAMNESIKGLVNDVGEAKGKLSAIAIKPEGQIGDTVLSFSYLKNDDVYLSRPSFDKGIVAVGLDNKEYSAEDLQNQQIIIPYKENGQEVFFQGRFNENNQWDGECLINVYQDGIFVIATEAIYDNGKRKEYQQLFPNGDEWVFSRRVDQTTFNGGDTWKYEKIADGKQTISFDDPDPADMIHPSEVEYESGAALISHYHGNTSEGKYNDESGEAYLIAYYDDGYTRLVYQGKFVNGLQDDDTGEAWQIARDKVIGTNYMLYKGVFKKGKQMQKAGEASDWENPLSSEKMKQYTEGKPFEDELNFDMAYIKE